jgi:hypothetical protein
LLSEVAERDAQRLGDAGTIGRIGLTAGSMPVASNSRTSACQAPAGRARHPSMQRPQVLRAIREATHSLRAFIERAE